MELEGLKKRDFSKNSKGIYNEYSLLEQLVQELQNRELPPEVVVELNDEIVRLNEVLDQHLKLHFYTRLVKNKVLKTLINDLEIVPKNYYRNLWLAIGMSVIGLPLGIILSTILGSISFVALGLPIGLTIGVFIGTEMDKKALENNKQLEIEMN
tara:strand:+ start:64 stop:525 length:462 start_codon:yes stop_codon:yes gene_type:complete